MHETLRAKYTGLTEKLSFDIDWKKKYTLRLNHYLKLTWNFQVVLKDFLIIVTLQLIN